MKTPIVLDTDVVVPFWNVDTARRIIQDELDSGADEPGIEKYQSSEENYIVYTVFSISITGEMRAVKKLTERIKVEAYAI